MKIHKRWTPNLIAGVLFLSVFFVPCAGVRAQDGAGMPEDGSSIPAKEEEQPKVVPAEEVKESPAITVPKSVETSEAKPAKKTAPATLTKEETDLVQKAVEKTADSLRLKTSASGADVNEVKKGVGSLTLSAWIIGGVLGLLTLACIGLLIFVLFKLPKQKDPEAEKKEKESERDKLFDDSRFKSIQDKMNKIDGISETVNRIKPPTVDAISGAVKEDVKGIVSESVKDLNTKIDKLPKSDKIAEEVYNLVGTDTEKTRIFVESVEEKYKKLDNMLSKCGDLVQLQDKLTQKQEDIDAKTREHDARLEDIKTREAKLNEEKSGLAEKIEEAEQKLKNQFEQEKKDLEYSFELERKDFEKEKAVFEKEKASLEQTYAQEKADLKKDLEHSFELERTKSAAEISGLQTKVDDLNQKIDAYSKQLKNAEDDKTRLEGEKATLSQEKQTLNTEKQTLTDRINELTAEKLTLRDEIQSGYESQIQTLNAEKDQLANELASEKRQTEALEEKNQKNQQENERLGQELAAARNLNQKAESIIYPAEFLSDPRFAVLKQHLDGWTDTPESAVVRASLQLFSQRASLKEDTVVIALRDIAFGISQTLSSRKAAPSEIIAELISWRDFIQGYSNENLRFNLSIPNLGDAYTNTTMTSARKIDRVQKVLSWSVVITRQTMNPIKKLAEVE